MNERSTRQLAAVVALVGTMCAIPTVMWVGVLTFLSSLGG